MSNEEGNKLIAEFMGYKIKRIDDTSLNGNHSYFLFTKNGRTTPDYYPDTNWNELMPVVENVENLGFKFQICRRRVQIMEDTGTQLHVLTTKENTKIEATWLAVIEFINWYNNQNR